MNITCATFFNDNYNVLIVHPTNERWINGWSLPKGICDPNETYIDAAAREFQEEVGYTLDKTNLISLGIFPYRKNKDFHLFKYDINILPKITNFNCSSYFTTENNQQLPEVDEIKYINIKNINRYLNLKQLNILKSVNII